MPLVILGLPLGQRIESASVIRRNGIVPAAEDIVIAVGIGNVGGICVVDAAVIWIVVVQDVVTNCVDSNGRIDTQGPTAIRCHVDRIVVDKISHRPLRAIDLEHGDSRSVIVIEKIVPNRGVLDAIQVNRAPSRRSVVVDHVVFEHGAGDNAVSTLGYVGIELNTSPGVVVNSISAEHRPVTAIGDVDAMLELAAVALIVLNQQMVGKVGEDPPLRVIAENAVLNGNIWTVVDANRGTVGIE